jgi:predicted Rossmann fold nucleotide-binding protein DprA/Smf involved in DNA uptake
VKSHDTSTAALLLVNRITELDCVKPLSAREYWDLLKHVIDPAELLGLGVEQVEKLGLEPELADRVVRLLDASVPFAFERERLESGGIQILSTFDEGFPSRLSSRLGSSCPAFLLLVGAGIWVDSGGLGVVGSRDVAEAGIEVARDAAAAAARRGEVVVSGLARGVDQVAMSAALDSGGLVTGVPSEGLSKVSRSAEIRRHVLDERLCLVSPYGPNSPFSAGNAMARNKLIYALSDRTLVIASDKDRGGTWAGATEAIRRHFGSVAVWMGEGAGSGNTALAQRGATPIRALHELDAELAPAGQLSLDSLPIESVVATDGPAPTGEIEASGSAVHVQGERPVTTSAAVSLPLPTGSCWCGCGTEVEKGAFFAPRHDAKAATDAVVAVYGSVEMFLATHGYGAARPAPERGPRRRKASTKKRTSE